MPRRNSHARQWRVTHADCLDALPKLAPSSVATIVTDPPYGISVNGLEWDRPAHLDPAVTAGRRRRRPPAENPYDRFQQFSRAWATACMGALKPGAHVAAFAAPRTAHRLACGLEEAGLEVRDVLMWLQGQGYPATRLLPDGLGTGLKPAWEPIILARKPLHEGSLDTTLAKYGTGALNIDACRLPLTAEDCPTDGRHHGKRITANQRGRWPANLLLSHHDGCTSEQCAPGCPAGALGDRHRFFYCAKAPRRERDAGCEELPRRVVQTFKIGAHSKQWSVENPVANVHPTVKLIDLMRWLVRLTNPYGDLVLDPFAGSGSTGIAAVLEGAPFHGIEREAEYVPIARARITHWSRSRPGARRRRGCSDGSTRAKATASR